MSTLTATPPGISKDKEFWVDVEVPYSKIVEKWDRKYKPKLKQHIENGRLQKRVLAIYFKMMGETDFPHERTEAIEELERRKKEWVINLCCQLEFSTGISESTVQTFAEKGKKNIIDVGLEEEYNENIGDEDTNANKDGLTALCQLADPELLREMLIYSRVTSRYPKAVYKRDSGGVPSVKDWENLIGTLSQSNVENYEVWYQFKHGNQRYIAIEQEDRDGVERQVGGNIEQEPANLIILHFDDQYLDIYTDSRNTANITQTGVNKDVLDGNYEEDKNTVTSDEVGDFAESISSKDRKRQENKLDIDYVLTDVHVSRTTLANNPELKISSGSGVGPAINQLNAQGYDILSDPKYIDRLKIRYEGYKFTITNKERRTGSGQTYRELLYGCHADSSTRKEFEKLLKTEFQIDVKYESSSE